MACVDLFHLMLTEGLGTLQWS